MYKSDHIITGKHYLVVFVFSFISGIFLTLLYGLKASLFLTVFALVPIFVLFILIKYIASHLIFKKKYIILSVLLIVFLMAGIFRAHTAIASSKKTFQDYVGKEVWIYGTIATEPKLTSSKFYSTFELDTFMINDNPNISETILLYIPSSFECNVNAGDDIFCWAKIENPDSKVSSYDYDYTINQKARNIFFTGKTKNINPVPDNFKERPFFNLKQAGTFIRTKILFAIENLFPDDKVSIAILKGILTGDKSDFDKDLYRKFSSSGISHIVAVSGLHLSILFSFLTVMLGLIFKSPKISGLISIPFILLFMAASLFTPSVCRASVMIIIMIISSMSGDEYDPITSLFMALGIIVFISPYALLSKSLVLSFSATLGIFVFFPYVKNLLESPFAALNSKASTTSFILKRIIKFFSSSLALSVSSFLGTVFFLLLFFGKISKIQFLTNLWIVPIVGFIFCLGYVSSIIFYIFPWISQNILKYPIAFLIKIIKLTIETFGKDKFTYTYPKPLTFAHFFVYFGIILIIYMTFKALRDIKTEKEIRRKKLPPTKL